MIVDIEEGAQHVPSCAVRGGGDLDLRWQHDLHRVEKKIVGLGGRRQPDPRLGLVNGNCRDRVRRRGVKSVGFLFDVQAPVGDRRAGRANQLPVGGVIGEANEDDDHWDIGLLPVGDVFRFTEIFERIAVLGRVSALLCRLDLHGDKASSDLAGVAVAKFDDAVDPGFYRPVRRIEKAHGMGADLDESSPMLAGDLVLADGLAT